MNEILMFHRILPAQLIEENNPYFLRGTLISTNRLEAVIKDYLDRGYSFLPLSNLFSSKSEKNISLTFDDGYSDNFFYALPILEKYKLQATFYPIIGYCLSQEIAPLDQYYEYVKTSITPINYSDWIDGRIKQEFLALSIPNQRKYISNLRDGKSKPNVKYMTRDQLNSLSTFGHEIGAHSYRHDIYTRLRDEEIIDDIEATMRGFKSIGLSPVSFAYPDGRYNERIIGHIQDAGFQNACAVKSHKNIKNARYELERKFVTEYEII